MTRRTQHMHEVALSPLRTEPSGLAEVGVPSGKARQFVEGTVEQREAMAPEEAERG